MVQGEQKWVIWADEKGGPASQSGVAITTEIADEMGLLCTGVVANAVGDKERMTHDAHCARCTG